MTTETFVFTGRTLKEMFVAARDQIEATKNYLDAINVFPIPDGDTGINLFKTISRVIEELDTVSDDASLKDVAKATAKGAFKGAKGNSGVITSQFIIGFCRHLQNIPEENVTPQVFADALQKGYEKAYKAVLNPREGTILTVIRDTAQRAKELSKDDVDWTVFMDEAYEAAMQSTNKTPELMPLLKEAGVVDAGAQGFVYILNGWRSIIYRATGNKIDEKEMNKELDRIKQLTSHIHHVDEEITFRYCSEYLVHDSRVEDSVIRAYLEQKGDSLLVVAEDAKKPVGKGYHVKIHVHTNEPQHVFSYLGELGTVKHVKIDDMKYQAVLREEKLGLTKKVTNR